VVVLDACPWILEPSSKKQKVNSSTKCCHQNESHVLLHKPQQAKVAHDAVDTFMLPSRCLPVAEDGTKGASSAIIVERVLTPATAMKDLTRRSTAPLTTPRSSDRKVIDSVVVLVASKPKTSLMVKPMHQRQLSLILPQSKPLLVKVAHVVVVRSLLLN